jgi:hypothetical protein
MDFRPLVFIPLWVSIVLLIGFLAWFLNEKGGFWLVAGVVSILVFSISFIFSFNTFTSLFKFPSPLHLLFFLLYRPSSAPSQSSNVAFLTILNHSLFYLNFSLTPPSNTTSSQTESPTFITFVVRSFWSVLAWVGHFSFGG